MKLKQWVYDIRDENRSLTKLEDYEMFKYKRFTLPEEISLIDKKLLNISERYWFQFINARFTDGW